MAKEIFKNFSGGIVAGICITLGCIINLSVGGTVGAFMFSFGLLAVILWRFPLYTGNMGFSYSWKEFGLLWITLIGNILGCAIAGLSISYTNADLAAGAEAIVSKHLSYDWLKVLILSIWCGFIMTIVVKCGRMQPRRYLGIVILGIAVFILSGYIHSIADAGYIFIAPTSYVVGNIAAVLPFYGLVVAGNYIGGNLVRLIRLDWRYSED